MVIGRNRINTYKPSVLEGFFMCLIFDFSKKAGKSRKKEYFILQILSNLQSIDNYLMINALIIVDTRRETKQGFPLKIRVHDQIHSHRYINLKLYQSEKELIRTPFLVQREFQLNQEIEYCNKNGLNLEQSLEIIKEGVPDFSDLDSRILLLELELNRLKIKRSSTTFDYFFDDYIKNRKEEGKSVATYITRLTKFKSFLEFINKDSKTFLLNDLDYEILQDYKSYLIKDEISSLRGYFQTLNTFYKEAQKRKSLHIKQENPFELIELPIKNKKVDKSINLEDFKSFVTLNLSIGTKTELYQRHIDLMKFQFLIGGHDFIELANLKWKDIKDGRIKFYRFKNNHRGGGFMIDNMLHPLAIEIIERYGTKDNERVFSFIIKPEINNPSYNNYLGILNKQVNKGLKKSNINFKVRTKDIRYTFRTIGGNLMINQMMLEKIMGHSNSSISMGYQGATPYEIQDAEHLKIINEVFSK